jgi:tRNA pseudouridine13 synthase
VRLRADPGDFRVDEVPLVRPAGTGGHLWVRIEKRDLTTGGAIGLLARALRVPEREIGHAGRKDRRAIATQWLSLPARAAPALDAVDIPGLCILEAAFHPRKLRLGHLRGNAFRIRLPGLPAAQIGPLSAGLDRVAECGLPNLIGPQRFGARGDNHLLGAALLRKDGAALLAQVAAGLPAIDTPRVTEARAALRDGRPGDALRLLPRAFVLERALAAGLAKGKSLDAALASLPRAAARFLVAAWQSSVFNAVLVRRAPDLALLDGDIAMKSRSQACFLVDDASAEARRFSAFEICPTGPLPGRGLLRAQGIPGALEAEVFRELGVPEPLDALRGAEGTRRPLRVRVENARAEVDPDGVPEISFELPRGAFATALLGIFGWKDSAECD